MMDELVMEVKDIIKCVPYPHTASHLDFHLLLLVLMLMVMMMYDAVLFRVVSCRDPSSDDELCCHDSIFCVLCCMGIAVCHSALRPLDVISYVRRYKGNNASSQFTIQFAIFHCCRVVYDVLALR